MQVELSDIHGFAELPDGKVLSGTERGSLLLWDGNMIKFEVNRRNKRPAHAGAVDAVVLEAEGDRKYFVTCGHDGCASLRCTAPRRAAPRVLACRHAHVCPTR